MKVVLKYTDILDSIDNCKKKVLSAIGEAGYNRFDGTLGKTHHPSEKLFVYMYYPGKRDILFKKFS